MALERRDVAGAAVITELAAGINQTDLSITIASSTGWPSGGASGPFFVVVDEGLAGEEKIEVASRTGTTLTVASTAKRGVDDTSAGSHATGASIKHCFTAQDADEANYTMAQTVGKVTTKGDLLAGTGANALARQAVGSNDTLLTADTTQASGVKWAQVATAGIADDAVTNAKIGPDAVGAAELAANAVDTAAIAALAVTAAKIANDTITATQIAAGAVGSSEIATDAVGAAEIAAGAVGTAELASDAVTSGKLAAGALDDATVIVNNIIPLLKLALEDPTNFTPTAASFSSGGNLTVGTGGSTYGYRFKVGLLTVGWCGFAMAADGNLPAGSSIRVPVPFAQKALGSMRGFVAARARRASDGFIASGTGVIQAGNAYGENIATAGSAAEWDATVPFNWGTPGDGSANLDCVFFFVAAA